jgi:hypothetical protein
MTRFLQPKVERRNRVLHAPGVLCVGAWLASGVACGGSPPPSVTDGSGGVTTPSGGAASGGTAVGAGGVSSGGAATGGAPVGDGGAASGSGGIVGAGGTEGSGGTGSGGVFSGTCTPSVPAGNQASGSGPYEVVVETNPDPGIEEGTIFRPAELGGEEKFPIFVWGEGGCSLDGLSNATAMAEIASHGYFVVADGTPGGSGSRDLDSSNVVAMGEPLLAYIDWAIAENDKPCSAYYQSLDGAKVAANGFSCGGLMAEGTAGDPRMTTWGLNSSGMFAEDQDLYDSIHTPVLLVEGGPGDQAYENGLRDYENISELGVPLLWFSKDLGHGGDLFSAGGGDFTKINLAWLNWWLKGDETATGRGLLVGSGCPYCSDSEWEAMSENVP